jgi:uncharacterized protein (DUF58 family)
VIQQRLAPPPAIGHVVPIGRFAFGLSARTLYLLGAGLITIGPALVDRRALWVMALWDAVVLALAFIDFQRLAPPATITVKREWTSALTLGLPGQLRLDVANASDAPVTVRLADYLPPSLRRDLATAELTVGAAASASTEYALTPSARGDHEAGEVAVTWWSPWRLIERWGCAPLIQTVRVYPDLAAGRGEALFLIRSRQVALEKRRTRFAGFGREFESLRDYREGDEQRDVAWAASARRGRLVTRVYQPERSQTVWILVDAGRLLQARTDGRTLLDMSVTAALTLAQVATGGGDRVGLLAYGRRVQHRLAPSRGPGHLRAMVDALATVHTDAVDADHGTVVSNLLSLQKRRALIVWLTEVAETAGVPEVIERAMGMTSRHAVIFAVMRQGAVRELAASIPGSASEMYRVVAAQEALERRDGLLHALRNRGALVLESAPAALSSGIVSRYLEAKERGLL